MRTAHRLLAPTQLAGAAQTAVVGDAGLRCAVGYAFATTVAGAVPLAGAVVPTPRLAAVAGQRAALSDRREAQDGSARPLLAPGGVHPPKPRPPRQLARV